MNFACKKISILELWSIKQFRSTRKRQKSILHIFFIPLSMTLATILFWNCLLPSKRKEATWKQPFLLPNMYIAQYPYDYNYVPTLIAYEKVYLTFNRYIWPNMFEMLFHFRRNFTMVTKKSSQVWDLNPCYIVAPRWFSNYQHARLLLCQNHHKFRNSKKH